jgi:hypothetical protein
MLLRSNGEKISLLDPNLRRVVEEDPVTAKALDAYIAAASFRR